MRNRKFSARTARVAKRRALQFWYLNRTALDLSLRDFFQHCRLAESDGMTHITFYPALAA
jgi:hypothetical protein